MKEYKPLIIIGIISIALVTMGGLAELSHEKLSPNYTVWSFILEDLLTSSILFAIICGFYFPINYFIEKSEQKTSRSS